MRYRPSCLWLIMPLKFDVSELVRCKGLLWERNDVKDSKERTVLFYEIHSQRRGLNRILPQLHLVTQPSTAPC